MDGPLIPMFLKYMYSLIGKMEHFVPEMDLQVTNQIIIVTAE